MQSQIEAVFSAALACNEAERDSIVAKLCGDNAALRSEVTSLLQAAEHADDFLDTPVLAADVTHDSCPIKDVDLNVDHHVGAYRLLDEIGRGGMGVVYRAERADGEYEKQVAVKLLRRDIGTGNWKERFTTERQILANLNHPNIAQLIDGGTTDDGQSYLVMEFVDGIPVTDYCQQNSLSITQRLQLFKKICEAVNVAHTNLVVHRDLKPDNIFVTDKGEPKLLDFGVAKLMSVADPVTSSITEAVPFTPQYAAPEQLNGSTVTTATDIYALGILLWELLCKSRPFGGITNIAELIRTVVDSDIPAPSKQVSDSSSQQLRGDLDAITLKALSKAPAHRYGSVNQLIDDIDNYLHRRPVVATKAGWLYRLRKFVTRNAISVVFGLTVLMVLLTGVVTTFWQYKVASAERDLSQERYEELRNVVKTMVFELPERIVNYPGSEALRVEMTEHGVALLDMLREQQPDDTTLIRDLAQAYHEIGNIQGSPGPANLGKPEEAIQNFNTSLSLAQTVLASNPGDDLARQTLILTYMRLAYLHSALNQVELAKVNAKKCVGAAESWMSQPPSAAVLLHVRCLTAISFVSINENRLDDATDALHRIETMINRLHNEKTDIPPYRLDHLTTRLLEDRAALASRAGKFVHAIELETQRLAIYRSMPDEVKKLRERLIAWGHHALAARYAQIKDFDEALPAFNKSVSAWREIINKNKIDLFAIRSLALVNAEKARVLWDPSSASDADKLSERRQSACEHYALSVALLDQLGEPFKQTRSRYRWSPTPAQVYAERHKRCD